MMQEQFVSNRKQLIISIGLITFIAAITYLPLIDQLGLYRDDWYLVWSGITHGPQKFAEIFAIDRPAVGFFFSWIYILLGNNPLPWNIFSFIARWAGFLGVYWIASILWPRKYFSNTLITILFVVYPGFLQQPNAYGFSFIIIAFSMAILSIALTLQAAVVKVNSLRVILIGASTILTASYLLLLEYLIGMEGVRLILLWYLLGKMYSSDSNRLRLTRTIRLSFPSLILASSVFVYRIFFFESTRPAMNIDAILDIYSSSPFYSALRFAVVYLKDQFEIIFGAWSVPVYNLATSTRLKEYLISMILCGISVLSITVYYYWVRKNTPGKLILGQEVDEFYSRDLLILGLLCVAIPSLPVVLSNRNVIYQTNWDRYTLSSSFGAAIVLYGLLTCISKDWLRITLYTILVGVAVSTHYNNAVYYRDNWESQKQYWWQLTWRAPHIKEGTVLVGITDNYRFEEDYELWSPANLTYYPGSKEIKIRSEVLDSQTVKKILSDSWDRGATRTIDYERDYENTLVAYIPSPMSCLHVVDGDSLIVSEFANPTIIAIAPHSIIDRISTNVPSRKPPVEIFGPEPNHTWCYFYQKGSLAAQKEDWEEVARLGREAQRLDLKPADWSEWFPFIEGYAYTGDFKEAKKLIPIIKELPYVKFQVCEVLEKDRDAPNQAGWQFLHEYICLRK
jgi:hypothetical protein